MTDIWLGVLVLVGIVFVGYLLQPILRPADAAIDRSIERYPFRWLVGLVVLPAIVAASFLLWQFNALTPCGIYRTQIIRHTANLDVEDRSRAASDIVAPMRQRHCFDRIVEMARNDELR